MVLSYTFLELGQEVMSSGVGWVTTIVLRTSMMDRVRGGWSACLDRYLRRQLLGPDGLATTGCPVLVGGQHRLIFGRLTNILSDGEGIHKAMDWKGASGLKPCIKHFNVFKKA